MTSHSADLKRLPVVIPGRRVRAAASRILFTLLLTGVVSNCGSDTASESPADSQTHWLEPCADSDDCDGLQCICGYCAQRCTSADDCSGTSADRCVDGDDEAARTLCGAESARGICLTGCEDDDDCGRKQSCSEEACLPDDLATLSNTGGAPGDGGSGGDGTGEAGSGGEDDGGRGGDGSAGDGNGGNSGDAGSTGGNGGSSGGATGGNSGNGGQGESPAGGGGASGNVSSGGEGGGGGDAGSGGAASDPFELPTVDDVVIPGDAYRICDVDDDCILVESACSQCCQNVGINAEHDETYWENYSLACMDYMGGVCDCFPEVRFPQCDDGLCVAAEPESEEEEQRILCEQSGGAWDDDACGEFWCGLDLTSCDTPTPSCNCGGDRQMDPMFGCLLNPDCSATPEEQAQLICEATDGSWDEASCGHYVCGQPPACTAIDPGCDCGVGRTYQPAAGCTADLSCSDPVMVALCEDTGGMWDPTSCGHYYCGLFPDCDAIDPGCDCGDGQNFDADTGCLVDAACEQL